MEITSTEDTILGLLAEGQPGKKLTAHSISKTTLYSMQATVNSLNHLLEKGLVVRTVYDGDEKAAPIIFWSAAC